MYESYYQFTEKKPFLKFDSITLKTYETDFLELNKNRKANFWGITVDGVLFRIKDNQLFKVEDTSGLVVYSFSKNKKHLNVSSMYIPVDIGYGSGFVMPFFYDDATDSKDYFFSTSFTSDLKYLSKQNLASSIKCDSFQRKLTKFLRWYKLNGVERRDDKTGQFYINKIFTENCK